MFKISSLLQELEKVAEVVDKFEAENRKVLLGKRIVIFYLKKIAYMFLSKSMNYRLFFLCSYCGYFSDIA